MVSSSWCKYRNGRVWYYICGVLVKFTFELVFALKKNRISKNETAATMTSKAHCRFDMGCTPKGFLKIGNGLSWIVNLRREDLQLQTTRLLHDILLLVEVWWCLVPGASTMMPEYALQCVACLSSLPLNLCLNWRKIFTARTKQQQPWIFKLIIGWHGVHAKRLSQDWKRAQAEL